MPDAKTTAWMWKDEQTHSIQGVSINLERGTMEWYNSPGCACTTNSEAEQPIADFLAGGPRYLMPPQDVMEEIESVLTAQKQR